ncbi:alpha/beta hydrolase [Terrisporobacter sp.]
MSLNFKSKKITDLLAVYSKQEVNLDESRLETFRNSMDGIKIPDKDMPRIGAMEERIIKSVENDIRIKVYYPEQQKESYPCLVYLHGGGWALGVRETGDYVCSTLTKHANCVTVSVDYRLAPGNKFPAAFNDCYFATKFIYEHPETFKIDPSNIFIAGDSAGGNLAAAVVNTSKDKGIPKIQGQILVYPSTAAGSEEEFPSIKENGTGNLLTKNALDFFLNLYANSELDMKDPRFSPILYPDFRQLPASLIITAGKCPLRDEGKAYAKKLKDAGVETEYMCYDDAIHGFLAMYLGDFLDESKDALEKMGKWLVKHYK